MTIPQLFKQVSIVSILCLALFSFTAKAQQVISLQKAVDLTLKNNLTIKQAAAYRSTSYRRLQSVIILTIYKHNRLPAVFLYFWPKPLFFHLYLLQPIIFVC